MVLNLLAFAKATTHYIASSTRHTYWTARLANKKATNQKITDEDKAAQKYFRCKAMILSDTKYSAPMLPQNSGRTTIAARRAEAMTSDAIVEMVVDALDSKSKLDIQVGATEAHASRTIHE